MRISQRLQDFLTAYCGSGEDLDETARVIRSAPGSALVRWLRPELDAAIEGGLVSPDDADYLMSRRFGSATEVAQWLRNLRAQWFG
jgi:hypothetical protein